MFAKKNLVAAAALLAIAGAAQADVKLYGTLDEAFGSFEDAHAKGTSERKTALESGGMMTSYIGFAGSEDLGGGLKAEFALETFLAPDTGATVKNLAGNFWSRTSWVGLSGNFGRVALGQYDNPLFTSGYTYNPFGSSFLASPTMRHFYSKTMSLGFDTGWVNAITYESPVVQGFNAIAQFAPKETSTSGSNNSYAAAGAYNNGPISAMLTYEKAGYVAGSTAYLADQKVWNLGASYDFGAAKLFGQYTDLKTSKVAAGSVDVKNTIYQIGVSVPVSEKLVAMASFGSNKENDKVADTKAT
ncbi:MAG TPA: porin, partial [Aquabacterium sp.]|nr:porin [Aquabacterium sp.]